MQHFCMATFNRTELVRIAVYNRRWITFAVVLIVAYGLFNSLRPGTEVLMTTSNVAAGQSLKNFVAVRAAELPEGFVPLSATDIQKLVTRFPLSSGTILSRDVMSAHRESAFVTISISVEPLALEAIPAGSHVHVWALEENHSGLVSENAQLVTLTASSMSTIATLRIPPEDEYAVMQASAIRITGVT